MTGFNQTVVLAPSFIQRFCLGSVHGTGRPQVTISLRSSSSQLCHRTFLGLSRAGRMGSLEFSDLLCVLLRGEGTFLRISCTFAFSNLQEQSREAQCLSRPCLKVFRPRGRLELRRCVVE